MIADFGMQDLFALEFFKICHQKTRPDSLGQTGFCVKIGFRDKSRAAELLPDNRFRIKIGGIKQAIHK